MNMRLISFQLACLVTTACVTDAISQSTDTQTNSATRATNRLDSRDSAQRAKRRLTTVRVEDIHCKHCGKRLARKLFTVPGVVRVRAKVTENVAIITPQEKKPVSPQLLWEAAEAAGFKVLGIDGPAGKITQKPSAHAGPTTENTARPRPATSDGGTRAAR